MKKILSLVLALGMTLTALAGCGSEGESSAGGSGTGLSGTVATDGSTSMETVIEFLREAFTEETRTLRLLIIRRVQALASRP